MRVEDRISGQSHEIEVLSVKSEEFQVLSKSRFWFNWNEEKKFEVFKLSIKNSQDILGLISLKYHHSESREEIRLLAVSKENRGKNKKYDHIAGNLIAYACTRALTLYGEWACVSLRPKTQLIDHYIKKYGLIQAGRSLFVDGLELINLIRMYNYEYR